MGIDREGELDENASMVIDMLCAFGQQKMPPEMLRIDAETRAIVVDVNGTDYILTMTRAPKQRE